MSTVPKIKMIIAVKGIIGSGKSTLSEYIEKEYGYTVFNCDAFVHQLYETNDKLQTELTNHFALESFSRKALGDIVFNNPVKLKELEDIVFPYITSEINRKTDEKLILDCQIIDKLDVEYDIAIICSSSIDTIIKRVKLRDNRDEEEIRRIINIQNNTYRAKKRTWAVNTELDLQPQIEKILGVKK